MIFSLEKTKHTDEKKRINRCAAQSPLSELQCPLRSSHANPRRFKRELGVRFRVHIDWQVGGSMQSGIADTAIICARALPSSTSHPRPGPLYYSNHTNASQWVRHAHISLLNALSDISRDCICHIFTWNLPAWHLINNVESFIGMANDHWHFSHLLALLQQFNYFGATDITKHPKSGSS